MFRISFATLVLILSPAVLAAEEMSFGGIEVGVTTCRQARGLLEVLSQSFLALAISLSVAYIFFLPEAAQVRAR